MSNARKIEKIESLFFGPRIAGKGLIGLFEELQSKLKNLEKEGLKDLLEEIREKYEQIEQILRELKDEVKNTTYSTDFRAGIGPSLIEEIAILSYNITILFVNSQIRKIVLSDDSLKELFTGDGNDGLFRHAKEVLEKYGDT